jgi:dTDP-glucose pyrophosphorylase
MEEFKVLIPTSGLGSRLGNITKYTNKSLVRVGDIAAISHVINSYPKSSQFVITLGHYGSHIRQYLMMAHPDSWIDFVDVDNYMGEGSSLLYSISLCEEHLQCPFVLHVCDTIVPNLIENEKLNFSNNWIIGGSGVSSQSYRTINTLNGKVVSINEKGEKTFDSIYVGVVGIFNYSYFWEKVKEILSSVNSNDLSDCHVIRKMLDKKEFKYFGFDEWYDIGNVDSLRTTKEHFKSTINVLEKEDENIFLINGRIIKFFHNKKICSDRISRSNNLINLVPPVINGSENFYCYDYVDGCLLSDVVDINKFRELLNWSVDNLWKEKESSNYKENALSFYKDKTLLRVDKFLQKYNIEDKEDIINGITIPPIKELIENIKFDSLIGSKPTGFHGDFILDNIIYNIEKSFTLIDWRQDFNGNLECGDMHYDIAKLNHSLTLNHKILSDQMYIINIGDSEIYCDVYVKKTFSDCRKLLRQFCLINEIDYEKIKILTSLIWVNMAPLHEHPLDMFLYYFGKYNLYLNIS